jgi:homogentisate 1,2-dioxygenase
VQAGAAGTDICPTAQALASPKLQPDYYQCWQGFQKLFNESKA